MNIFYVDFTLPEKRFNIQQAYVEINRVFSNIIQQKYKYINDVTIKKKKVTE